jgi:hypothetical protein
LQQVPQSARRVQVDGKLVPYESVPTSPSSESESLEDLSLSIQVEREDGIHELGSVEVDAQTTLHDVRDTVVLESMMSAQFVFLVGGVPLTIMEERSRLARLYLPRIMVRSYEEHKPQKFTTKVHRMILEEERKRKEEMEFQQIMARIRSKTFLKAVK